MRGATDRTAIEYYVRESLNSRGYTDVAFLEIPAHRDNTAPIHGTAVKNPTPTQHRGNEIRRIIKRVAKLPLQRRGGTSGPYVIAAAVESTETWCLSAFQLLNANPERLSGSTLCQEFMKALHASEGRSITGRAFATISKDVRRRKRFCRRTSSGVGRIEAQCYHYKKLIVDLCQVI